MQNNKEKKKTGKDEVHIALGRLIRDARNAQAMSQLDLAQESNTCVSYICGLEKGYHALSVHKFLTVCQAMSVSPVEIIEALLEDLPSL